jgi:undecaprenyl pyrophosphate synthase
MRSNHSAARAHLERAYDHLRGNDETSRQAREALDLLIEALAVAEYSRRPAEVVGFPVGK